MITYIKTDCPCVQIVNGILKLQLEAEQLREAADIIEYQVQHIKSPIWIRSMVKKNIAKDAGRLVQAVRWRERSGQKRSRTWAKTSDERERGPFLMGYQPRIRREAAHSKFAPEEIHT